MPGTVLGTWDILGCPKKMKGGVMGMESNMSGGWEAELAEMTK